MVKKKRPSLKDFLSTGQVIADETQEQPTPLEETSEAVPAGEPAAPKKKPAKPRKPRSAPTKKAVAAPEEAAAESAGADVAQDVETVAQRRVGGELRAFVDMLCDEDRKTWEKIFEATGAEFLPLDFVERREDFRTMDRSRYTLFRLDEAGKPLFHIRTSVQIREPLIALLKWDETGKATIYRP